MKKLITVIAISLAIIASFILIKWLKQKDLNKISIGIMQTASHPALDAAQNGFIDEIKKLIPDVELTIKNVQGSIPEAQAIAQQFHSDKKFNGFFTIATPTTQAMSAVEKERPILITAVTDPNALGLIYPNTNITGTNDMINVAAEVNMLAKLLPNAKKVGIIYTAGEENSIAMAKEMHKELKNKNFVSTNFTASEESDMQAIVELACRESDAIITPTDNVVASTISLIAKIALKHKTPLIVSDNMLVKYGALAARGVDYKKGGRQTARIAYDVIIKNKKPYQIPVQQIDNKQVFINKKTLEALNLSIPESLKDLTKLV